MAKKARKSEDASRPKRQSAGFDGTLSREDAAARLEALARELRAGRLVLDGADGHVDIPVAAELSLGFKARSSAGGKKSSLKLSAAWSNPGAKDEPSTVVATDDSEPASDADQIVAAELAAGSAPEEPAPATDADEPNPD